MYLRKLPHRHLATVVAALTVVLVPYASSAGATPEAGQTAGTTPAPGEVVDAGPTPPDVGLPPEGEQFDVVDTDEIGEKPEEDKVPHDHDHDPDPDLGDEGVARDVDAAAVSGESAAGGSVRDVRLARTGFAAVPIASIGLLSIVGGVGLVRVRQR